MPPSYPYWQHASPISARKLDSVQFWLPPGGLLAECVRVDQIMTHREQSASPTRFGPALPP
jgi:hypothetical protein